MLDLKFVCDNLESVKKNLSSRGDFSKQLEEVATTNQKRKKIIIESEKLKQELNTVSQEIAELKKQKKEASTKIASMKEVSDKIKEFDQSLKIEEEKIEKVLMHIPNMLHSSIPSGKEDSDDKEIRRLGNPPSFSFAPKDHLTLGEKLNMIDVERASKLAGSRFAILKGWGAKLERALINFMLDINSNEGKYQETFPPVLANSETLTGTGQLPKFADEMFKIEGMDFYLISTAEIPLTNIYRNEILEKKDLPLLLTAYTPCFRKEAGSYGKDIKGLIRQHQFNKVEIVRIVEPERSYEELEILTQDAERILQRLELPYRVVVLCAGNTGFSSAKTYDLEVWLPSQNRYREISSCSNCEDFQARRMNLKYRSDAKAKPKHVHTLNGSALAVGRTLIAILENFQQKDGSIRIPKALIPYLGTDVIS